MSAPNGKKRFVFRLYVAGGSPNSAEARKNLQALADQHLRDRHKIEVVDVLREPRRAFDDGIMVTPTLVKLSPPPICKLIGDLSETTTTLAALGLSLDEGKGS